MNFLGPSPVDLVSNSISFNPANTPETRSKGSDPEETVSMDTKFPVMARVSSKRPTKKGNEQAKLESEVGFRGVLSEGPCTDVEALRGHGYLLEVGEMWNEDPLFFSSARP